MIGAIAILAAVVFIAGAGAGFLLLVALGIRREDKQYSMTLDAPDRVTNGVRRANGLHTRGPGVLYEPAYSGHRPPSGQAW